MIKIISATVFAAVVSAVAPENGIKKALSVMLSVFLFAVIVSSVSLGKANLNVDIPETEINEGEAYGQNLTTAALKENLRGYISDKTGIERENVGIELNMEKGKVSVKKVELYADKAPGGLSALERELKCEIEVIG